MDKKVKLHVGTPLLGYLLIAVVAAMGLMLAVVDNSNFSASSGGTGTGGTALPADFASFYDYLLAHGVTTTAAQKANDDVITYAYTVPSSSVTTMSNAVIAAGKLMQADPAYIAADPKPTSGPIVDKYFLPVANGALASVLNQITTIFTTDKIADAASGNRVSYGIATSSDIQLAAIPQGCDDIPQNILKPFPFLKGCKFFPEKTPPFNNGCLGFPRGGCITGGNSAPYGPGFSFFPGGTGGFGIGGHIGVSGRPVPVLFFPVGGGIVGVGPSGGGGVTIGGGIRF